MPCLPSKLSTAVSNKIATHLAYLTANRCSYLEIGQRVVVSECHLWRETDGHRHPIFFNSPVIAMYRANPLGISRVVFTGDLLRPFPRGSEWESATWKNIRWLQALISPHLGRLGIPQSRLAWDAQTGPAQCMFFDTPALYDRVGLPLGMASWTRLANLPTAAAALTKQIAPHVDGALVIGYEMPNPMLDALQATGTPYIDVVLHAVRFLPDLVFAMRTNHAGLHDALKFNRVQESDIEDHAADIKAKAAWMAPPAEMPPGSLVIFGQVHGDRSLINNTRGGFFSLQDHLPELIDRCDAHSRVFFKPHPYDMNDSPSVRAIKSIGSVSFTTANAYHLMAQEHTQAVAALNSSCLLEARYFGKESIALIPPMYDFSAMHIPTDGRPGALVAQTPTWLSESFWRHMLRLEAPPTSKTAQWAPNRLRKTMNADWGFGQINKVMA